MKDEKCNCEKCDAYKKYLAWKAEQRNEPESPPVATTYTKSYVSGEFGDTSKPLEYITLKAGDRELAVLPLREIVHMANELREEIERYRMEHKPAAASLDSENV
jgi:hypothetical protein